MKPPPRHSFSGQSHSLRRPGQSTRARLGWVDPNDRHREVGLVHGRVTLGAAQDAAVTPREFERSGRILPKPTGQGCYPTRSPFLNRAGSQHESRLEAARTPSSGPTRYSRRLGRTARPSSFAGAEGEELERRAGRPADASRVRRFVRAKSSSATPAPRIGAPIVPISRGRGVPMSTPLLRTMSRRPSRPERSDSSQRISAENRIGCGPRGKLTHFRQVSG